MYMISEIELKMVFLS